MIITGEGSADGQTLMGKIPVRVLEYGLRKNVPVMLIAGKIKDAAALLKAGFSQVQCITPKDIMLTEAMKPNVATDNIQKAIMQL